MEKRRINNAWEYWSDIFDEREWDDWKKISCFAEVSLLGVEWRSVDHALPPTRWMTAIGWSCARSNLLARDSYESKRLGEVGGSDDSMVMSAEDAIM